MRYVITSLSTFLLLLITPFVFAYPKEIIIIRHADKLVQNEPGPTLSAKGELRAIKFAFYFLDKFGEPDYLIAANAVSETGKNSSQRELETLAPLANILAERHSEKDIPILHPYTSNHYPKLVKYIFGTAKFDEKKILICWHHAKIKKLVEELGVKSNIDDWPDDDFDTVYDIHFTKLGKIENFEILKNQYPIQFNGSWRDIYNKLEV
ncbi:MAG: phosphoglycerate mutase [uncultured bacterium]|nr:MAG: phosphoglycerate mutase [uncultured bacterium]